MNLGDRLRELVETIFPYNMGKSVSYSAMESQVQVKFKGKLPNSQEIGLFIAQAMNIMHQNGYTRLGDVWSSIEAGVKMSITVRTRIKSQYE